MNNIDDLVEIYECPLCGGAGILEEDCGSSYYVTCLECGCKIQKLPTWELCR